MFLILYLFLLGNHFCVLLNDGLVLQCFHSVQMTIKFSSSFMLSNMSDCYLFFLYTEGELLLLNNIPNCSLATYYGAMTDFSGLIFLIF
jgi:hypothetical protein